MPEKYKYYCAHCGAIYETAKEQCEECSHRGLRKIEALKEKLRKLPKSNWGGVNPVKWNPQHNAVFALAKKGHEFFVNYLKERYRCKVYTDAEIAKLNNQGSTTIGGK